VHKNVASQNVLVYAYDKAAREAKTGDAANITAYISLDGGASTVSDDVNPTELNATDLPGMYRFDLLQAETDCDMFLIVAQSSTPDIQIEPVIIYTEGTGLPAPTLPVDAVAVASEYVERYTGIGVTVADRVQIIEGGLSEYVFDRAPVNTLDTITDIRSGETVDLPEFTEEGRMYFDWYLPRGSYRVEYNAGYAGGALPDALTTIIAKMAADIVKLGSQGPFKSETIEGYSYTRADAEAVAAPYKSLLDLYVRY